jgi:hypothetical protein
MLHFLGAFSWVRETFCDFTIVCVDFTLKNFPTCYTLVALMKIAGAKLVMEHKHLTYKF